MRPTGSQYKYPQVHCAKVFTANSPTSSSRCMSLYKLARQGDFFKKLERLEATTGLY